MSGFIFLFVDFVDDVGLLNFFLLFDIVFDRIVKENIKKILKFYIGI